VLTDLWAIHTIHIDPAVRAAWVEAGTTAGRLTAATAAHGLVIPFGDSPTVGVGGITLGGGGNFGVVTRFRYRLHPIGTVLGGALLLPATGEVVRSVVDLADAAPDELTTIMLITRIPPPSIMPPEAHGRLAVLITLVWCGDLDAGERTVNTLRTVAPPIADLLGPRPYPSMYQLLPEAPRSVTNITHSLWPTSWTRWRSGRSCSGWRNPACRRPRRWPQWRSGCSAGRSAGCRLTPPPCPPPAQAALLGGRGRIRRG
jgi:hypothetical protein